MPSSTGMKCLPSAKLPQANGNAIHDWHAEVLAMRAFNLFILQECQRLASEEEDSSEFLQRKSSVEPQDRGLVTGAKSCRPFTWREGITLHMYCSEAPCMPAASYPSPRDGLTCSI